MKKKPIFLYSILMALILIIVLCSGAVFAATPGTLKWKYDIGEDDAESSPAVGSDGTIYCGSDDSYIYAITQDGKLKWRYQTGDFIRSSPAIGPDGTIYCGSNDYYMYALNPDGTLKWRYKTGHWIFSSPAVDSQGNIYFGSGDWYIYCLKPDGTLKWRYQTGNYVSGSPVIGSDGRIYCGSTDGYMYCFLPDGSWLWKYKHLFGKGIYSTPAVIQNGLILYFTSADGILYGMSSGRSGNQVGIMGLYDNKQPLTTSPVIGSDGTVYCGGSASYDLLALNPDLSLKWKFRTGYYPIYGDPVLGPDGTIYYGSHDNHLHALSPDGKLKWQYETGFWIVCQPALNAAGTIAYFSSRDGYLYALNLEQLQYYIPVFKPPTGFWSGMGVTNLSSISKAEVSVAVYSTSGSLLTTESKLISVKGQDSFLVGTQLKESGWIKVSSDQPLAGLNFLGQYATLSTKYYLGDVPFTQTLSKLMVVPHVAQNETWDTTIYLANPNATAATVTLTYTNKSGTSSTPYAVSIPSNGSKEITVFKIAKSNSVKGGYVTISSNQGLTGFALYHNLKTNNYSYAGINAVDISK